MENFTEKLACLGGKVVVNRHRCLDLLEEGTCADGEGRSMN